MSSKKIIINADLLYNGIGKMSAVTVVIQGDQIVDVSPKTIKGDISGVVTPAFIDAHSHIGMERQGEPVSESEVDDFHRPFSPLQNPVDSIYFDDRAFVEAVDFGVLYSCVVPGSGNLLGGRAVIINNFSPNRKNVIVKDYGFKMALGFNPRASIDWKGTRHNTRMGNASLIEKKFSAVLRKEEKASILKKRALLKLKRESLEYNLLDHETKQQTEWIQKEYTLALSSEQWAVYGLATGEKTIKVHVHKEDDALFLIDLKKKYNLNVTAEHACGILRTDIFNDLSDNNIPIVYGPMISFDSKVELMNASYKNVISLMESRAQFGLMTDHPVVLAHHLRDSLKYFLIQGMPPEEAINHITLENAKILKIEDKLGSIEIGKLASLVVWDKDPFHMSAFPRMVIAEGNIIRDNR